MIISEKNRFLFVGIPFSASSMLSKELIENYDGSPYSHKHSNIPLIIKKNQIDISNYVKFAVLRRPEEITLSVFNKYKTNAHNVYTDPQYYIENGGHVSVKARKIYRYITDNAIDYQLFIKKFYRIPYDSFFSLNYPFLDFVIMYENLEKDFDRCLNLIGLKKIRKLPVINKTQKIEKNNKITEGLFNKVFGPFYLKYFDLFKKDINPPLAHKLLFKCLQPYRFYKWNNLDKLQSINPYKEYDKEYQTLQE